MGKPKSCLLSLLGLQLSKSLYRSGLQILHRWDGPSLPMCPMDNLDNFMQGKLEVTWNFIWKSPGARREQGERGVGLKVDSKTVGLIVAFQFQLYRGRECGDYSLIHRPWTLPNAQPRSRAIFPRQSEDRSEPCLWQAAPAANRHTLINIWTATCNWKTASLKNDIELSTCCCEIVWTSIRTSPSCIAQ